MPSVSASASSSSSVPAPTEAKLSKPVDFLTSIAEEGTMSGGRWVVHSPFVRAIFSFISQLIRAARNGHKSLLPHAYNRFNCFWIRCNELPTTAGSFCADAYWDRCSPADRVFPSATTFASEPVQGSNPTGAASTISTHGRFFAAASDWNESIQTKHDVPANDRCWPILSCQLCYTVQPTDFNTVRRL